MTGESWLDRAPCAAHPVGSDVLPLTTSCLHARLDRASQSRSAPFRFSRPGGVRSFQGGPSCFLKAATCAFFFVVRDRDHARLVARQTMGMVGGVSRPDNLRPVSTSVIALSLRRECRRIQQHIPQPRRTQSSVDGCDYLSRTARSTGE